MSKVNYPSSSPYFDTPQTSWYLSRYVDRPIPSDPSDTLFTVTSKYQYRPDTLSYDCYGTAAYWWVFMQRNIDIIRDPIWGLLPGIQIYLPSNARLQQLLG